MKPYLPPPLDTYWRDQPGVQAAYKELAAMSLAQAKARIRAKKHVVAGTVCYEFGRSKTPKQSEAIVLSLPFANSLRLDMALRAWLILQSLPNPQRVFVFPQNTIGKKMYTLSATERNTIRQGDFSPITRKQRMVLEHLGVERCAVAGYSLGAAYGVSLLRELAAESGIRVTHAGLFEAPNVMNRANAQLIRAFGAGGWKSLARAIQDARLPVLDDLRSLDTPGKKLKDKIHFLHFAASSLLPSNRAIMAGCTYDRFASDLLDGLQKAAHRPLITIGGAEKSAVMPPQALKNVAETLVKAGCKPNVIAVDEYGHEMGDNIVAHTVLIYKALMV